MSRESEALCRLNSGCVLPWNHWGGCRYDKPEVVTRIRKTGYPEWQDVIDRDAEIARLKEKLIATEEIAKYNAKIAKHNAKVASMSQIKAEAAEVALAGAQRVAALLIEVAFDGPSVMVETGCPEMYGEWRRRVEREARALLAATPTKPGEGE